MTKTNLRNVRKVLRGCELAQTFVAIGKQLGITAEAARQRCMRGTLLADEQASTDPICELSIRLRNALAAMNCELTLDGIHKCFDSAQQLTRVPNIGTKSIAELQAWLIRHGKKRLP